MVFNLPEVYELYRCPEEDGEDDSRDKLCVQLCHGVLHTLQQKYVEIIDVQIKASYHDKKTDRYNIKQTRNRLNDIERIIGA